MKFLIIIAAVTMASCASRSTDIEAEGAKVIQLSKEWSEHASSGDLEKTLSYWADDAVLISPGEQFEGKAAIRGMVEESFKTPGFRISWDPKKVHVSESGDMAYLLEDSQVTFADSTGKPIIMKAKAVSIWRKQKDGTWKNVVDISTPAER
jgi:uncharacterized protein (TIGR02246 family)